MARLINRNRIVNRDALRAAVAAALELPEQDRHAAMLARYRDAWQGGFAEIRRRFQADQDGARAVKAHCYLADTVVGVMCDIATEHFYPAPNPTEGEQLCVVGYGGYGRGELAPYSDLDLLFLLPYKPTPRHEQIVEHLLYFLWDIGLKVGHATRSIDDCIRQSKADVTIRTGLLESRFLWGEALLFREFRRRFRLEVAEGTGPQFVEAKLQERDERHRRMGDSRYVLEPNIKEGKGGARDLQTLFWIAKYLYRVDDIAGLVKKNVLTEEEATRFAKAQDYLWTVRCHLHYLTGRPEERLTFDVQPELARRMGYTDHAGTLGVERFMKHYFLVAKEVGDLTRIFCAALEARHQRPRFLGLPRLGMWQRDVEGFPVVGGRLNVVGDNHFAKAPVDLIRLFEVSHRRELDIHPDALHLVTRNLRRINRKLRDDPEANRLFLAVLAGRKDPENTLRRMNEAGVFGRFVPDFGRVVAQMQYDMYHVYTTDEHTIRAIGILNRIERGELAEELPLCTSIIRQVLSREVLYVSLLLHDIAKGRGGDHSEIGQRVADRLCPRLGFTPEQTETTGWLVLHHLAMSNTAQKRDLDDPKTIADFVALVRSPERLRLLLCLTVADIRAVGPGRWNNWKATLLRELYKRASEAMSGGLAAETFDGRVAATRSALAERLPDWSQADREAHLARGRPSYWLAYDLDTLVRQARMIREAEAGRQKLAVDTRVDRSRAVTEVTIYAADHPGLFHKIAAAMAVSGANIVDARINTLTNGMALDTFWVQDVEGAPFERSGGLARLAVRIEQALSGELRYAAELEKRGGIPSRTRVFQVSPRVLIDNNASNAFTLIEINGRDRPGLLYDVTGALLEVNMQIASAKISTFGEQVVDVFYVKDVFGMKVDHPEKLKLIRERLTEAVSGSEEQADAASDADARLRASGRTRAARSVAPAAAGNGASVPPKAEPESASRRRLRKESSRPTVT